MGYALPAYNRMGSTTSTSGISDSPSAQYTNDHSSSLVTNEDDGAINSVKIDNQCYEKKDTWERFYSQDHKPNYFNKLAKKSV